MIRKKIPNFFVIWFLQFVLFFSSMVYAGSVVLEKKVNTYNPLFVGAIFGYGETDYSAIVANDTATQASTIVGADDHGVLGGLFLGYEFTPFFISEFSWVRYPKSKLEMAEINFYGTPSFWTTTNAYSLILQFLVSVYHTRLKAYSDAGIVFITRRDILAHISHVGPTFGIGLMYNMTRSLLAQFGFVYAAGYGKTIDTPLYRYVPFLLSAQFRIGYRLPL